MTKINSPSQKNTLLKNAQANAESSFFKSVFFLPPPKKTPPIFKKKYFFRPMGSQRTRQVVHLMKIALNKVCVVFKRHDFGLTAAHAAKIRLKEILKRMALFGNQTVMPLKGNGE